MRIDASTLPSRLRQGCRAELYGDGALKSFAYFQGRSCVAILELDEGRARGQYRHGVAGEVYDRGVIEPIGPFAGTGTPRKASESFRAWVRRQIDAIDALAASAGERP